MHKPKKHKIAVYGTLRPNRGKTVLVEGALFDLGWYPGIRLGAEGQVVCEIIEADDVELRRLDAYEGFNPDHPADSLYLREEIEIEGEKTFIYVFNQSFDGFEPIKNGDWLAYTGHERGSNHNLV